MYVSDGKYASIYTHYIILQPEEMIESCEIQ